MDKGRAEAFSDGVLAVAITLLALDLNVEAGSNARWAVLLYGISNIGMSFGFTAMLSRIVHRGLLAKPVPPDVGNKAIRRFGLGTIAYPVATALGLLWPPLMLIAIGALAMYYMTEQTQILPSTAVG